MKKGMSIMLDVPLDALAKRIAQVGTASRPLLDQPSADPYTAVAALILRTNFFLNTLISVLGVLACLQRILSLTRFTTIKYDIVVVLLCAQTLNETQQRIAVNIHAIFKTLYMYIGCRHFSFSLFPLVKMHDSMLLSVPQAFAKLSLLAEQRGDAYANADVRVSLEGMLGS
jgi:hypothetical protein